MRFASFRKALVSLQKLEGVSLGFPLSDHAGDYIDILAVSKDQKELLVVELKKGRASDVVVGQIQRYMGFRITLRSVSL